MNEYEIEAEGLLGLFWGMEKPFALSKYDLAIGYCDKIIQEWQHITDTFVSGSVTNEYKLEYWQKVREILLQQKQTQDERES